MYDWANSVYSLVITSTVFPVFYEEVTTETVSFFGIEFINTALFSYSISLSFLLIALLSPFLSSIADYSGNKKGFMQFFCYLGAIACSALYFFNGNNIEWGIICFMLAGIGYSGSIVFYNAYLPEIAPPQEHDKISARGFSLGYIGSMILLAFNLFILMKPEAVGLPADNAKLPAQLSFLAVGAWWSGFAQITFKRLPRNFFNRKPQGRYLLNGYKELQQVLRQLQELKGTKVFLLAFFFYSMGLQTVMYLAASFGKSELELESNVLIATVMVIQLVGILGAYLFSSLSGKVGNIGSLSVAIIIWIGICVGAYFIEGVAGCIIVGAFVGLVMGGVQALSRSTYSKMLPETQDHASYFSFYDVMEKVAIVLGTFVFGLIIEVTGSMRNSILALITFFVIGLILLLCVKRFLNDVQKVHLKA